MAELGALKLRIEDNGGTQVLGKLRQIDNAAKLTSVTVDQAAKALNRLGIAAKVSGSQIVVAEAEVQRASGIVRQLGSDAVVTAGQVDQTTASVGRLGQRAETAGVAATKLSPRLRSGASAVAALSIAAATGGGSLAGMATQAGLVASVMATEFAPAKWAGYAAGIGAAVVAVTALVGILKRLHEEASAPREAITNRIDAIRVRGVAEDEARRRREELDRARANLASTPAPLTVETIRANMRARAAVNRAEAENAAAVKKLAELTSAQSKELEIAAIEGITRAAEATRTVRLSEIAKEQAAVEAAFQQGTADLKQQYDARRKAVVDGAKAETDALRAAQAEKLKARPGEDPKGAEAVQRRQEAASIGAEITALANETAARLTALDQQRAAEERALAQKVLGYQVQLEQFNDTSFHRRMEQIAAEDQERRRVLNQRGGATAQELADLDALTEKQRAQLFLQKAQADLARLQADLQLRIGEIENKRLAGLIDAEEASRQIADTQRSALPSLQEAVNRAIQWAEKLGDQGVLGQLKEIKALFSAPILIDVDIQTDKISKRLNAAIQEIQARVNRGVLSEEAGRKLVQQEQLAAGFASAISDSLAQGSAAALQDKNPLAALGSALSSSLGSLLVDVGTQWLKASTIMASIQSFFLSNPLAAIGAAAALIVFGSALGGSSGGSGGGFSGGSTAPTPISISRFVVDPNAGLRSRVASTGRLSTVPPGPAPRPIEVIGINTPRGQELIGTASGRYQGRGG